MSRDDIIQEIYKLDALVGMCMKDARVLAEHIARGDGGREVALAFTSLQQAKSWLRWSVEVLTPGQPVEGTAKSE